MSKVFKKPLSTKRSFGLACCRYNTKKNKMEMLMIRKRYTFYFVEFILGHYYPNDDKRFIYLFNRISADEKLEIESLNFSRMWYKVWLTDFSDTLRNIHNETREYQTYCRCKKKFENTFLRDQGRRLKTLLNLSQNQDSMWEIPKGRKNTPQEPELNCAKRETMEEVGITPVDYTIIPEIPPFEMEYSNEKAKYINKYFICIESSNINDSKKYRSPKPYIDYLDKRQVSEVVEIKWMSLEEIQFVDYTKRFAEMAKHIFRLLVRRYRLPKMTVLGMI